MRTAIVIFLFMAGMALGMGRGFVVGQGQEMEVYEPGPHQYDRTVKIQPITLTCSYREHEVGVGACACSY